MAKSTKPEKPTKKTHRSSQQSESKAAEKPRPPWTLMKNILTCKNINVENQQKQKQPTTQKQRQKHKKQKKEQPIPMEENTKKSKKTKCSGLLCNNTKVMHRPEPTSPDQVFHKKRAASFSNNDGSNSTMKTPLREINNKGLVLVNNSISAVSSSSLLSVSSSINGDGGGIGGSGSLRGMPFRRFSGCYECRMVVDPVLGYARDPSLRASICTCPECGEIMKPENLELHQAVRHAVSELGAEDTSKNIVEIIFQSSWLKKQTPVCKIDRILKVHNTPKTIAMFEEYRACIKARATKFPRKHPRCIADGNELLRFHCTTLMCSLGLNGSSNLCNSIPHCNICSIIKNGFKLPGVGTTTMGGIGTSSPRLAGAMAAGKGILTTATSGKAHDRAEIGYGDQEKRAMLVCRVIAGRVKKSSEGCTEEYDSVGGGCGGVYSNLDELYVFNNKAILPCFVVIYRGF
ncbi:hypothetical protein Dimus_006385 [Dionaea muscipula]